ncbi:MAG TPA: aspartyl protease family protein [Gemmatimonadaceae bacterium]|nr:aspartyl protease family protein [Gemmatimonadaceae bacterium]
MTFVGTLCLLMATSSTAFGTAATQDTISDLVHRYMAWRGGAAYESVASVHEKGRVEAAGLKGAFEQYDGRDGRERTHLLLGALESSSGVSPSGSWTGNQGVIQEMDSASARDARRMIALELGDALLGRGVVKLVERPDETRDGHRWAVLGVEFGGPDRYDVFLDRATGKLLGWRITQNRVTRFRRFGDWRMVAGVRMPFLTEDLFKNPAQNFVQRDDVIELNVPLPDSLFKRPESIRMAQFAGGRTETDPIPFTFYNDRRIYIPGKVNGHRVYLLLDSGAGSTVLDKAYAERLGVKTEGKGVANGTGGQVGMAFARDVHVEIGNMTLRVPTAIVLDLSSVAKQLGHPMPVILGVDVFEQLIVDVDFGRHTIAFHDPAAFQAPPGATTVPLNASAGARTVPVRIEDGPEVQADFDIGNGGSLLLFPSYWRPHHMLQHRTVSERLSGGVGGRHAEKVLTVESLTFAGHTFHDIPASLTKPGIQAVNGDRSVANLGIQMYSRFRVMTDFPHDRLYLVPNATGLDAPFPRDRSGLNIVKEDKRLRVLLVSPGSPAQASGWKTGDIITAVNGHPIGADYGGSALSRWAEGAAGTKVTLTLSDGATRSLTLRDYY